MQRFKIALTNVQFDNSYNDAVLFNNDVEKRQYFNADNLLADAVDVNVDLSDLETLNIVYKNDNFVLPNILNFNYALLQDTATDFIYYYFITDFKYMAFINVALKLELDVITTFQDKINYGNSFIMRAMSDRFYKNELNLISYNNKRDSECLLPDNLSKNKSMIYTHNIKEDYGNNQSWFDTNVSCWVYFFVNDNITFVGNDKPSKMVVYFNVINNEFNGVKMPYGVIVMPIYKTGNRIKMLNTNNTVPSAQEFLDYLTNTDLIGHLYSIKISKKKPFSDLPNVTISGGDLIINTTTQEFGDIILSTTGGTKVALYIKNQSGSTSGIKLSGYDGIFINKYLSADDIKNSKYDEYDPQQYGQDCLEYVIADCYGNEFIYNPLLLNFRTENQVNDKILKREIITSEIQKVNIFYKSNVDDNEVLGGRQANIQSGYVGEYDNSLMYGVTQYADYIANNKNYWAQRGVSLARNALSVGANAWAGRAITNNYTTGKWQFNVADTISGTANIIAGQMNESMRIDNMQNAPEQLKGSAFDALFATSLNETSYTFSIRKALDIEIKTVTQFHAMYGYKINKIGNIRDYLNKRKYFNYIQASIETLTISGGLSNSIRNKIKEIFAKGIRFWNITDQMFKYDKQNYERWLDD